MPRTGFDFLDRLESAILECRVTNQAIPTLPLPLSTGIDQAVKLFEETKKTGQKVALIGNGGSAAIASHQAVDLCRTCGVRAITFNDPSLLTCLANDFGFEEVFAKAIEVSCEPGDLLIAISSSGMSRNILNGVQQAGKQHCTIITLSGFNTDNSLSKMGALNFYVPSSNYGIVEAAHLVLTHSMIDQFTKLHRKGANEVRRAHKTVSKHVANSAG